MHASSYQQSAPRERQCAPSPGTQPVCVRSRLFPSFQYGSIRPTSCCKGLNRLGGVRGSLWGRVWGVGRAAVAGTSDPEAGGWLGGLGSWRGGEKMDKRYGPTVHARGIHRKLAKSELHNFAWSSALLPPPKGSNFKTDCGERIYFFPVPQSNA